jgi:hypothetical protein
MAKKKKKKSACKQVSNRTKNGRFQKGFSGNPSGRAVNPWRQELESAIRTVEKRKRKKLMVHAVNQAFKNDIVLVAILKKLLPDLKIEEIGLDAGEDLKSFVSWLIGRNGDGSKD